MATAAKRAEVSTAYAVASQGLPTDRTYKRHGKKGLRGLRVLRVALALVGRAPRRMPTLRR